MKQVVFLLLAVFTAGVLYAQNAQVSGFLKDPSGAIIPNARISITNADTSSERKTTTNDVGLYTIPLLPPGKYVMVIEAKGFATQKREGIILEVGQNARIDFTLPVGTTQQAVTVQADASMINATDGSVSTVVDRNFVENMPLNGRSFQALIMLTPGMVTTPTSYQNQGQFSINGQRTESNYFTVDGVSANVAVSAGNGLLQTANGALPGLSSLGGTNSLVSVDAMQEFRVQTSSFAPEYGRTPGAQISIVTRSGDNSWHGGVSEYFRNDRLDANNWFANKNSLGKPEERQNDFGGLFSGPLIKDKLFFFYSYEGLRLRQPQTEEVLVPSLTSIQAAPAALQPYLSAFPVPNAATLPNGLAQYNGSFSNPSTLNASSIRIDWSPTQRLSIFGRYNYSPSSTSQYGANVPSDLQTTNNTTQTATLGLTTLITPRLVNELKANYSNVRSGNYYTLTPLGGAVAPSESSLFPPGITSATSIFGFEILGAGGQTGAGAYFIGTNALNEQRQVNLVDNLSQTVGTHQIKIGIDYRYLAPISRPDPYLLTPIFNGVTGSTGIVGGKPLEVLVESLQETVLESKNFSFYAQDTWKALKRLTVTYGFRWDINPAIRGKNAASNPFVVQAPASLTNPAGIVAVGQGPAMYRTTYGNFAPRVGIAYNLRARSGWETVLRTGAGIFYDISSGSVLGAYEEGFAFFSQVILTNVSFPVAPQLASPPAITQSLPTSSIVENATDPQLKLPRTYQWNIAVEQSVGPNQTLTMTYLGAAGRQLLRGFDLSAPNQTFRGIVVVTTNSGTSDYEAFQAKFQRRLSRRLQAVASYTFSHSLDNASSDLGPVTPTFVAQPNIDRGNSDFDVRHSFSQAVTYDLPMPGSNRLARVLLGGWSVDNLLTARTALPVNLTAPLVIVSGTQFNSRPNVISGVPLYLYAAQYPGGKSFNKAAFTNPAAGTQGNLGKNIMRGFGEWQDDFALRRRFQVTDRLALQFRAEAFNMFNHPNFGAPTATLSSALFGQATQMLGASLGSGGTNGGFNPLYQVGGPRSLQLALKLQF